MQLMRMKKKKKLDAAVDAALENTSTTDWSASAHSKQENKKINDLKHLLIGCQKNSITWGVCTWLKTNHFCQTQMRLELYELYEARDISLYDISV